MLLDFGITPYLVFDGDSLPSKGETNAERRKKREESKAAGLSLLKSGKTAQAYQELQKSATVTPHMAKELIEAVKRMNVRYIVAPYEADAQLVYLEQKGMIDGILSEDSDMLVYGAKRLVTKLNQYAECVEIERSDFTLCTEVSLAGWTDTMFRRMAILSGCDYLPNIEKMGLKTAHRYVRRYKDAEKVIQVLRFENKLSVPNDYVQRFQDAELTFIHHRVFCPVRQEMVFLQELDQGMKEQDMPYLGAFVAPEIAIGVACGDLNPKTKQPYNIKVTPRPLLRGARRDTAPVQTLKPAKSIESFFPKRQPLAELDPNSLTPSPSQQNLLQRHANAAWEPRLVSSAPQPRTVSNTNTSARSLRTDRNSFLARASTMSIYQPPKRPRLCSDFQDSPPSKDLKQSPFFAAQDLAPSPSVAKASRNKKAKSRAFDIWSDDSVEDVLLGLPDVQETATPDKAHADSVPDDLDDHHSSIPQSSPAAVREQSDAATTDGAATDATDGVVAQTPFEETRDTFEDILDSHIRGYRELRTFAYQPETQREDALRTLTPSKNPVMEPLVVVASPGHQEATLATLPKSTSINELCVSLVDGVARDSRDTKIVLASPQRSLRFSPKTIHVAEALVSETVQYPIMPAITGSEDDLGVPDSESELDEDQPTTLNLRAFAYAGS